MPGVEQARHRPALGHVVQLLERAEVAEEALGLLGRLELEDRVEERFRVGGSPVLGHRPLHLAIVLTY